MAYRGFGRPPEWPRYLAYSSTRDPYQQHGENLQPTQSPRNDSNMPFGSDIQTGLGISVAELIAEADRIEMAGGESTRGGGLPMTAIREIMGRHANPGFSTGNPRGGSAIGRGQRRPANPTSRPNPGQAHTGQTHTGQANTGQYSITPAYPGPYGNMAAPQGAANPYAGAGQVYTGPAYPSPYGSTAAPQGAANPPPPPAARTGFSKSQYSEVAWTNVPANAVLDLPKQLSVAEQSAAEFKTLLERALAKPPPTEADRKAAPKSVLARGPIPEGHPLKDYALWPHKYGSAQKNNLWLCFVTYATKKSCKNKGCTLWHGPLDRDSIELIRVGKYPDTARQFLATVYENWSSPEIPPHTLMLEFHPLGRYSSVPNVPVGGNPSDSKASQTQDHKRPADSGVPKTVKGPSVTNPSRGQKPGNSVGGGSPQKATEVAPTSKAAKNPAPGDASGIENPAPGGASDPQSPQGGLKSFWQSSIKDEDRKMAAEYAEGKNAPTSNQATFNEVVKTRKGKGKKPVSDGRKTWLF